MITAVYSRHMSVWPTHSQTLAALLAGYAAAWGFFGGVFHVVIPDTMKPIVTRSDAVDRRLSRGCSDCDGHAGFVTDTARVRTPQDNRGWSGPSTTCKTVWAGENFPSLEAVQHAAMNWCALTAGMRSHGTTAAQPAVLFDADEKAESVADIRAL